MDGATLLAADGCHRANGIDLGDTFLQSIGWQQDQPESPLASVAVTLDGQSAGGRAS